MVGGGAKFGGGCKRGGGWTNGDHLGVALWNVADSWGGLRMEKGGGGCIKQGSGGDGRAGGN